MEQYNDDREQDVQWQAMMEKLMKCKAMSVKREAENPDPAKYFSGTLMEER